MIRNDIPSWFITLVVLSSVTVKCWLPIHAPPSETGAVMLASRPAPDHTTPKPGFVMRSFFGVDPVIVSDQVC